MLMSQTHYICKMKIHIYFNIITEFILTKLQLIRYLYYKYASNYRVWFCFTFDIVVVIIIIIIIIIIILKATRFKCMEIFSLMQWLLRRIGSVLEHFERIVWQDLHNKKTSKQATKHYIKTKDILFRLNIDWLNFILINR